MTQSKISTHQLSEVIHEYSHRRLPELPTDELKQYIATRGGEIIKNWKKSNKSQV